MTPGGQLSNAQATQSKSSGQTPPGISLEYNHDLKISPEFQRSYPQIGACLHDQRLIESFDFYDRIARADKWWFERLGLWSLLLGSFPLLLGSVRMIVGESRFSRITALGVAGDFCAATAIVLIIVLRMSRLRTKWCLAVFCRERLRQWHFQMFLDGELMSQCQSEPAAFKETLDRRWAKLQQELRDGYGMMTRFVKMAFDEDDLFHPSTGYSDTAVANEVFDALMVVRFDHQLSFSGRKIQNDAGEEGLALSERSSLSETIATATFGGAVLVTAIAFLFSAAELIPSVAQWMATAPWLGRALAGFSLFLAVLSASSRAYRAGFTLPDESESYEEYCDRVREIKASFHSVGTERDKLRQMTHLEREAAPNSAVS